MKMSLFLFSCLLFFFFYFEPVHIAYMYMYMLCDRNKDENPFHPSTPSPNTGLKQQQWSMSGACQNELPHEHDELDLCSCKNNNIPTKLIHSRADLQSVDIRVLLICYVCMCVIRWLVHGHEFIYFSYFIRINQITGAQTYTYTSTYA